MGCLKRSHQINYMKPPRTLGVLDLTLTGGGRTETAVMFPPLRERSYHKTTEGPREIMLMGDCGRVAVSDEQLSSIVAPFYMLPAEYKYLASDEPGNPFADYLLGFCSFNISAPWEIFGYIGFYFARVRNRRK